MPCYPLLRTLTTAVPFEILAAILYCRALRLTDISLSVPFLSFTPVFLIITGFLMLGEQVKITGGIGIILIAMGAYSLNLGLARKGLMQPIKALFSNKGSACMASVALIYSITSCISKKAMLYSSPASIPFIYGFSARFLCSLGRSSSF